MFDPAPHRHRPRGHQDRDRCAGARRQRAAAPAHRRRRTAIEATLDGIASLVRDAEAQLGVTATVGIGIPGVISPATGLVKNANSIALNGHALRPRHQRSAGPRGAGGERRQLLRPVARPPTAPAPATASVFGVILGTGCGGGIVVDGKVLRGRNRIAGEWGHNPLPWPQLGRVPGPTLLVRPRGLPGDLDRRPRAGARLRRRGRARRLRHPGPRRRRRRARAGRAGSPRRPAGARAGARDQHARPGRDRAGRRPVQHGRISTPALPPLMPRYVFSDVVRHADPCATGTATPPACAARPGCGRPE